MCCVLFSAILYTTVYNWFVWDHINSHHFLQFSPNFFFKYVGASNIDYCILCNLDLLHFYWYLTENLY